MDIPEVVVTLKNRQRPNDDPVQRVLINVPSVTVDGVPLTTVGDITIGSAATWTGEKPKAADIVTVTVTLPVTRFDVADEEPG